MNAVQCDTRLSSNLILHVFPVVFLEKAFQALPYRILYALTLAVHVTQRINGLCIHTRIVIRILRPADTPRCKSGRRHRVSTEHTLCCPERDFVVDRVAKGSPTADLVQHAHGAHSRDAVAH